MDKSGWNKYVRDYRKKNHEKVRENERRYRERHPDRVKETSRKYRDKSRVKERVRDAVRKLYRKRKLELVNFMGGKCVVCGLTPKDVDYCLGVFVVDEIEPLGIGRRKFSTLSKRRLEEAKQLFLESKTQLLCQNCSAVKSWKNKDYGKRFHKKENAFDLLVDNLTPST